MGASLGEECIALVWKDEERCQEEQVGLRTLLGSVMHRDSGLETCVAGYVAWMTGK
jgi:hypothetical protein